MTHRLRNTCHTLNICKTKCPSVSMSWTLDQTVLIRALFLGKTQIIIFAVPFCLGPQIGAAKLPGQPDSLGSFLSAMD